ncbi:alpha/beta hydrolase-fold protein [uncultured Maricaulis sp.]|uniref:alpha/beta hydrolase-fold protein n=1 Tax=uncultured Maricaulis sp. TaxID=174710 RepID=UPI0030D88636|tara:strand:+ start:8456 stop:9748 length:1293 start_codon:yes stop_codon:yes gene_type:complete
MDLIAALLALSLILAGLAPAKAAPVDAPSSAPALASLAEIETLLTDQPGAVEQAWTALARGGLPRIEPIPGDAQQRRVTFLYKAGGDVTGVRLNSVINAPHVTMPVTDFERDYTLPLHRLGGSTIWALSLDVARDVQASYSFLVTGPTGTLRVSDPHNPRHLRGRNAEAVLILDGVGDLSPLLPVAADALPPVQTRRLNSAALGRDVSLEMHRAASGTDQSPVLILYDAFNWGARAPAWEIVHNLASKGIIPPMHVVLIDQLDEASAQSAYADQARFVADELLPFLRQQFGFRLARGDVLLGGASRRGLSAVVTGLTRPEAIGAVISLSGSFYWAPEGEAPEWLARQLGQAPPKAAAEAPRFQLAAGSLEYITTSTNQGHIMLDTNRNMAAALTAAGYQTGYSIYPGGHDMAAWRLALADALEALFQPPE